jgi:hypothetical protein
MRCLWLGSTAKSTHAAAALSVSRRHWPLANRQAPEYGLQVLPSKEMARSTLSRPAGWQWDRGPGFCIRGLVALAGWRHGRRTLEQRAIPHPPPECEEQPHAKGFSAGLRSPVRVRTRARSGMAAGWGCGFPIRAPQRCARPHDRRRSQAGLMLNHRDTETQRRRRVRHLHRQSLAARRASILSILSALRAARPRNGTQPP